MTLTHIALLLLGIFLGTVAAVEILRRSVVSLQSSWISTYLTGPYGYIEDVGFVALAAALLMFPHILNLSLIPTIMFTAGGIGVLLTMITRVFFAKLFPSMSAATITKLHVLSAGVAFAGAYFGVALSHPSHAAAILLAAGSLLCVALVVDKDVADNMQIAEKVGALALTIAAALRLMQ